MVERCKICNDDVVDIGYLCQYHCGFSDGKEAAEAAMQDELKKLKLELVSVRSKRYDCTCSSPIYGSQEE